MTVYAGTRPIPINLVTSNLLLYVNGGSPFSYRPGTNQPIWEDLTTNNNHMTIGANATFSDLYGGGLKRGASGNIATSPTLNFSGNYTISFWVKTLVASGLDNFIRIGPGTIASSGGQRTHRMWHDVSSAKLYYTSLGWNTSSNGPFEANFPSTATINNQLLYITATYDNTTENYRAYINTTLQINSDGSEPTWGLTAPGNAQLVLGEAYQNLEIYSLQVYNSVLTNTQITQNYNATKTRFGL